MAEGHSSWLAKQLLCDNFHPLHLAGFSELHDSDPYKKSKQLTYTIGDFILRGGGFFYLNFCISNSHPTPTNFVPGVVGDNTDRYQRVGRLSM